MKKLYAGKLLVFVVLICLLFTSAVFGYDVQEGPDIVASPASEEEIVSEEAAVEEETTAAEEETTAEEAAEEVEEAAEPATEEETEAETAEEEPAPEEETAAEKEVIQFDMLGLNENAIYRKYASAFNGNDITLSINSDDLSAVTMLRRFDFDSLDLIINFKDQSTYYDMYLDQDLLFPEETNSVTVLCDGEEMMVYNSAMQNLIISLWICNPSATINGMSVDAVGQEIINSDASGNVVLYEAYTKMDYIYELIETGRLEIMDESPVFGGKILFKIMDTVDLYSVECIHYGEAFYSFPSAYLARKTGEADMAVFIFPEYSRTGTYGNGGQAISTCTKVTVVNMHSMKMYETYVAVKNDPPADLEVSVDNGTYSDQGFTGLYEPRTAVNQILAAYDTSLDVSNVDIDKEYIRELLPWASYVLEPDAEPETIETAEAETTAETETAEAETTAETETAEAETTAEAEAAETETTAEAETTAESETTAEAESQTAADTEPASEDLTEEIIVQEDAVAEEPDAAYSWLTEELLYQIFDALGDDTYRLTYEALRTSGDLVNGSKGNLALGLQMTIIAFGKDIAADSSVGNATIGALNEIQEALGIDKTNRVNSVQYAILMPALLISLNEEAAQELLEETLTYSNGSLYDYLKAGTLFIRGKYYSAEYYYSTCFYGDYEAKTVECIQEMPQTGVVYRNNNNAGSDVYLTISVNNNTASVVCVDVLTENGELAACLAVRGTDSATVALTEGSYKIVEGLGDVWYGPVEMFGYNGTYMSMIFGDGTDVVSMKAGYDYNLTYNVKEHNENAQTVGSKDITWYDLVQE